MENIISRLLGHVYWMDKDNKFLGCNDLQAKHAGLNNRHEIVGKTNYEMPWISQADDLNTINNKVMANAQEFVEEEDCELADGTMGIFLSRKAPLFNQKGEIVGVLGISFDITDRKKMEQELIAAKVKEEASKVKDQFIYNMRHDIRTPFTGIIGAAELLLTIKDEQKKREFIHAIIHSSENLLNYLNEILELTQIEGGEIPIFKNNCDLEQLAKECLAIYLPVAKEKNIQLSLQFDQQITAELLLDEYRIKRILINLIDNALKFTEQGEIVIHIYPIKNYKQSNELVLAISVEDTGIGIPEDKQAIIFEKFECLTGSYEGKYRGSGVGLFAVHSLIKDLGGNIEVLSKASQGTKFVCTLTVEKYNPVSAHNSFVSSKKSESKKNIHREITKSTDNNLSILLVEDEPMVQFVTKTLLEEFALTVSLAKTGAEALEQFEQKSFDMILMDIGLPDMTGYDVTEKIRATERGKSVPIVALTAHAKEDVAERCLTIGMNEVLSKPLAKTTVQGLLSHCPKYDG